jgi:hypothetical protein
MIRVVKHVGYVRKSKSQNWEIHNQIKKKKEKSDNKFYFMYFQIKNIIQHQNFQ